MRTVTTDDVREAYARYLERWKHRNGLAPRLDLAEVLTGERFVNGDSFAGRNRESAMRRFIDLGSFDRSVQQLIDSGWMLQVSLRDAERRGMRVRGAQPNGRYYVSADVWAHAQDVTERTQRNQMRQRLLDKARARVLEAHQLEVQGAYNELCMRAGLSPNTETT